MLTAWHAPVTVDQAWQHASVIPALERLRPEDDEFEASLGYIVRLVSKPNQKQTKKPPKITKKTLLSHTVELYVNPGSKTWSLSVSPEPSSCVSSGTPFFERLLYAECFHKLCGETMPILLIALHWPQGHVCQIPPVSWAPLSSSLPLCRRRLSCIWSHKNSASESVNCQHILMKAIF
jgi:hypothetical protein